MSNQPPATHIVALEPGLEVGVAFEGDLLNRAALADRLNAYILRMPNGGVIAIDAPWGEGKSWFGRNWQAQLRDNGHPTIYLDAFANDFVDDPFLLLSAEILKGFPQDKPKRAALLKAAGNLGKRFLPIAVKGAVRMATAGLVGSELIDHAKDAVGASTAALVDAATDSADDGIADLAESLVRERLKELETTSKSVEAFQKALAKLAGTAGKPIVIFIDELDRCRPTFAIHMIERVKHFFQVPNVIFVLLLNRQQLEAAARGLYGNSLDASAYLSKFVHFFLALPGRATAGLTVRDALAFCEKLVTKHGYPHSDAMLNFCDTLAHLSFHMKMSLRDLEKCFIYRGLVATAVRDNSRFVAYLIALRVRHPDLYQRLLRGSSGAHQEALDLLKRVDRQADDEFFFLPLLEVLHDAVASDTMSWKDDDPRRESLANALSVTDIREPRKYFAYWLERLDVMIR